MGNFVFIVKMKNSKKRSKINQPLFLSLRLAVQQLFEQTRTDSRTLAHESQSQVLLCCCFLFIYKFHLFTRCVSEYLLQIKRKVCLLFRDEIRHFCYAWTDKFSLLLLLLLSPHPHSHLIRNNKCVLWSDFQVYIVALSDRLLEESS